MLVYLVLVLVCVGGIVGEGWWIIPIGSLGLCLDSVIDTLDKLQQDSSVPFDWNIASPLLQGFCNALATSAAIYLIGAGMSAMFSGGS